MMSNVKIVIGIFISFYPYISALENKSAIVLADEYYIKDTCMHWTDKSVIAIERLQGGKGGSRLYTVNFDQGEPCVVRLLVSSFAREKSWQEAEIAAMESASHAGVGPHIFAAHIKDDEHEMGYIVMQKINSTMPQEIPWNDPITYTQLGEFLKKMHAQSSVISVDEEAFYRRAGIQINVLKKKWQELGIEGLPKQIEKVRKFFEQSKTKLIPHGRTHLIHGDLIGRNLLYDGVQFWAVDWEHSRVTANPLFDLALIQDCFVPHEYHTDFMRGYYEQDELPYDRQAFTTIRILANCYVGMGFARIKPKEFVDLFLEFKKSNIDVAQALHSLICGGYTGEDKDIATCAALFFMQGYNLLEEVLIAGSDDDKN